MSEWEEDEESERKRRSENRRIVAGFFLKKGAVPDMEILVEIVDPELSEEASRPSRDATGVRL